MRTSIPAAALAATLLLAACGGPTSAAEPTSEPTPEMTAFDLAPAGFPVTVTDSVGTELSFDAAPTRIVSLSPTSTEILFAIGAGDLVVAADSYSDYPAEAPTTDLSAYEPNVEAIAGYEPDLVVLAYDAGDAVAGLTEIGVPVLQHAAATTLDDMYGQISALGLVTGHDPEATLLVDEIKTQIASIVTATAVPEQPLRYYHELDDTYYSATSTTFIGEIYSLFGLENIADAADTDGYGYPQLSAEYIIEADPQLIFLADADCCSQTQETVAARDGWDVISAVANSHVIPLDEDIVSRWGPRVVDFVQLVSDAIAAAA